MSTTAATLAAACVAADSLAACPADTDWPALAWALKAVCYEAFSSDPPRAAQASGLLNTLASAQPAQAEIAAVAAWAAGITQLTQGQMAEAVASFDRAAAGLEHCGRHDESAQTQVPKIMALSMLGRHDEAQQCAEQTQQQLLALGNLPAAGRVSLNLGALLLRREAFRESARHCHEAAVLFARVGDQQHSVTADIGQADALAALCEFAEALRLYARAAMRARQHGLALSLALVDESQALVHLAQGRYGDALAGLESACRGYDALALPQYLAIAEKQRADVLLELRLLPEALAGFDAALARFQQMQQPDEQAATLAQRGRTLARLARPQAARQALQQALALCQQQGSAVGAASVTTSLGELALAEGDHAAADVLSRQAAAACAEAGHAEGLGRAELLQARAAIAAGDPDAAEPLLQLLLQRAHDAGQATLAVPCQTALAGIARRRGQPESARALLEAAIEQLEDQRRALPGDELRGAFLASPLAAYEERLRLALAQESAAEALLQLERCRARSLLEQLGTAATPAPDSPPELQGLREQVQWLARRQQRELEEGQLRAGTTQRLLAAEQALLKRARSLRVLAGETAQASAAFDLPALQSALTQNEALVEHAVLDDTLLAFVVRRDGLQLLPALAPWPQVQQAIQAARFQLDALRHGPAAVQAHLPQLTRRAEQRLAELAALVWQPLQPALQGCRRALVVPHGELATMPFAALAPLPTALAASAAVALHALRRPPRPPRHVLALGDSLRLPAAAAEVRAVAEAFASSDIAVGEAANWATLHAGAGRADVLHLACHARFRADNPRFSALHLHDRVVTAHDIEPLPLAGSTVVLSACSSAVADTAAGNETLGLARAFFVAGAARVVASLWPVHDALAAEFMAAFYPALLAGHDATGALQQAQAHVRQRWPHPAAWAAFSVCGAW